MYLKSKLTGEVRYFDAGVQVSDYLNPDEYTPLDSAEIDKFKNPENYLSEEKKEQLRLIQFKPLTRRQFKLALLENGLLETVEPMIESIEDIQYSKRVFKSNTASLSVLSVLMAQSNTCLDYLTCLQSRWMRCGVMP
ncbi:MAG: hypothetical protein RSE18_11180 [Acinetobacter sp.]